MTNAMYQMHCDKCTLTNALWQMLVTSALWHMKCEKCFSISLNGAIARAEGDVLGPWNYACTNRRLSTS